MVTDCSGTLLLFNKAASDILGEAFGDTLPQDWPKKYGMFNHDGTTLVAAQSPLTRAISGDSADNLEVLVARKNTMGRWCSINLRPLKNAEGTVPGEGATFKFTLRAASLELVS